MSIHDIDCPHCDSDIEQLVDNFSDWLYINDLYVGDGGIREVKCPSCDYDFYIRVDMVPQWEVAKEEGDL
jgi:hypothetical protein